jgi:hypothetical protein
MDISIYNYQTETGLKKKAETCSYYLLNIIYTYILLQNKKSLDCQITYILKAETCSYDLDIYFIQ